MAEAENLVCHLPFNPIDSDAVCALKEWQVQEYYTKCDADIIDELNKCIEGGVVAVKSTCHSLANRLRQAIRKIKYKQQKCGGRILDRFMNGEYIMYVSKSDTESFVKLKDELLKVQEASLSWRAIAMKRAKEVSELLEAMAGDYSAFFDEIEMKDLVTKYVQQIEEK